MKHAGDWLRISGETSWFVRENKMNSEHIYSEHKWNTWFDDKEAMGWSRLVGKLSGGLLIRLRFYKGKPNWARSEHPYFVNTVGIGNPDKDLAEGFDAETHAKAMDKADEMVMEALKKEKSRIAAIIEGMEK